MRDQKKWGQGTGGGTPRNGREIYTIKGGPSPPYATERAQQISQQIIYGNVATAVAGGYGVNISTTIREKDSTAFVDHLVAAGIPNEDASELVSIMSEEEPSSSAEPFGEKAKNWIATNIKKAAEGTWNVGISVATQVLTDAALKYYGLK